MAALLTAEELRARLTRELPGVLAAPALPDGADAPAEVPAALQTNDTLVLAERLPDAARYLRDALGYTLLADIAVVDYLAYDLFEIVYRFYTPLGGGDLALKVRVPRSAPHVPSLRPFWPAADLHEREGFDLFGIEFEGHGDLRRIYMWDEFEGFPMRKDFPKQGDKYLDDA